MEKEISILLILCKRVCSIKTLFILFLLGLTYIVFDNEYALYVFGYVSDEMHGIPMFVFITSSKKHNQLEECLNYIRPLLQENCKIKTGREGAVMKALKKKSG